MRLGGNPTTSSFPSKLTGLPSWIKAAKVRFFFLITSKKTSQCFRGLLISGPVGCTAGILLSFGLRSGLVAGVFREGTSAIVGGMLLTAGILPCNNASNLAILASKSLAGAGLVSLMKANSNGKEVCWLRFTSKVASAKVSMILINSFVVKGISLPDPKAANNSRRKCSTKLRPNCHRSLPLRLTSAKSSSALLVSRSLSAVASWSISS